MNFVQIKKLPDFNAMATVWTLQLHHHATPFFLVSLLFPAAAIYYSCKFPFLIYLNRVLIDFPIGWCFSFPSRVSTIPGVLWNSQCKYRGGLLPLFMEDGPHIMLLIASLCCEHSPIRSTAPAILAMVMVVITTNAFLFLMRSLQSIIMIPTATET